MNKNELIGKIDSKLANLNRIKHNLDNYKNDKDILDFYNNLIVVEKHFNELKGDLELNLVPELFLSKIANNIQNINFENQFDNAIDHQNGRQWSIKIFKNNLEMFKTHTNYNSNTVLYKFYKDLGFFSQNIVIVGANGSGKTSLVDILKQAMDGRDGVVIPAHKLLIVPTFDSTPNFDASSNEYYQNQNTIIDNRPTFKASQSTDLPYNEVQKYGSEFKFLLKMLLAERGNKRNKFCDGVLDNQDVKKEELISKLDEAISIWNNLIEHREMFCDNNGNLKIRDKRREEEYDAFKMSDGEKIALFLIGKVLLAKDESIIIVDEPEMYLHKSIVDKLWNKLENERLDCLFVYLTHDLDFASNRQGLKYWIQDFHYPNIWDIEPLPENEIPENLLMKLLGSRKKILFCEGRKDSLDVQIFETLYPNYTITPVSSCKDVINYVRSFNKIPNRNVEAIGFIDRDFRNQPQLEKFESEKIYSYSVAEIENLFMIKEFIGKYAEFKSESIDFTELENKALKLLEKDKMIQTSAYVSSNVNYNFSESHVKRGNDLDSLKVNLEVFLSKLNLENVFDERMKLLEQIIIDKDYAKVIMYYNNKGLLNIMEDLLSLKPNTFRFKALEFLRINEDAKKILRSYLPNI